MIEYTNGFDKATLETLHGPYQQFYYELAALIGEFMDDRIIRIIFEIAVIGSPFCSIHTFMYLAEYARESAKLFATPLQPYIYLNGIRQTWVYTPFSRMMQNQVLYSGDRM